MKERAKFKEPLRWPIVTSSLTEGGSLEVVAILEIPDKDDVTGFDSTIFRHSHRILLFEDNPDYEHLAQTIGALFVAISRDINKWKQAKLEAA